MKQPFSRLAFFTDIHLGEGSDDKHHNEMCVEFVEWMITTAKMKQCDRIVFGGDWHHHRNKVGAETLNYSFLAATMLNECGIPVDFIIGNHDLFLKDSRLIHSLPFLENMDNIRIINEVTQDGDMLLVPWLVGADDLKTVSGKDVRYMLGHFELSGARMNEHYIMPETDHTLGFEDFSKPEYIFSGHFHGRQKYKTKSGTQIIYTGNCFPHSFSDVGDNDRGMMIFEYGGEPEFITWPDQPTYHKVTLSDFLDNPNNYNNRCKIKIIQDVEISQSERQQLRQMVAETYDIHHLSIEPLKIETDISGLKIDLANEDNIDNMVVTFINAQDYTKERLDNAKLVSIFMEAGR